MTIKHSIIHHLKRHSPGEGLSSLTGTVELGSEGQILSLFEQYKLNFLKRAQKQYGHFDVEQGDNPLPGLINKQLENQISFAKFSKTLFKHLSLQFDNTEDVLDAHVIFIREGLAESQNYYVFWISHDEALQVTGNLDLQATRYLDTGKLKFALKIDVQQWLVERNHQYLTLLTTRGDQAFTDAFTQFTAFKEGIDLVAQTTEFLYIVDEYSSTLPEEEIKNYKSQVLDYCVEQNGQGAAVIISDISSQLNEKKPLLFSDYLEKKQQVPRAELHTDRNSLKRYIRFFGRDKDMSISFSSNILGESVQYDERTGTLTIKAVPKSLKAQLSKIKEKAG